MPHQLWVLVEPLIPRFEPRPQGGGTAWLHARGVQGDCVRADQRVRVAGSAAIVWGRRRTSQQQHPRNPRAQEVGDPPANSPPADLEVQRLGDILARADELTQAARDPRSGGYLGRHVLP
jgi:hypothetical protein